MNNADMPAMSQPVTLNEYGETTVASDMSTDYMGLTKREHFAGLAMQGLLSHYGDSYTHYLAAVEYADALLKALEQDDD